LKNILCLFDKWNKYLTNNHFLPYLQPSIEGEESISMADFVQKSIVKSAVRELTAPIADATTFASIVQGVLSTNPFGCTAYETSSGPQPAMATSREGYTAKILYEDLEAKTVGYVTVRAPTVAAIAAMKAAILADEDMTTAMGGDPVNDPDAERYSSTIKCHDATGEIYYVAFARDEVRVTSYEADAILATIEAWADTVPQLA